MKKMSNKEKINFLFNEAKQWTENSNGDGSLEYAVKNNYKLHAVSLWVSSGCSSDVYPLKISYRKEKQEIKSILENAELYVCSKCNHHAFLENEVENYSCVSCLHGPMQYHGPRVEVVFKVFKGEILAIFKNIKEKNNMLLSYRKNGQHAPCSKNLLKLKNATLKNYKYLMAELDAVGYKNLIVLNKN
jgi:hypothetical protein